MAAGSSATSSATVAISAGIAAVTSWASVVAPIPMTLPSSSSTGRRLASSTSETRLVFSSATPEARIAPENSSAR